jgi:uncharacterized protein YndB with AHSA1/START domain
MTSDYGTVLESGAVRFERILPAPIERVWDYLTRSDLRAQWFAEGEWDLRPGGKIALVFHNARLSPGEEVPERFLRYEGYASGGEILRLEPPRLLVHSWDEEEPGVATEVSWELEAHGDGTRLVLTHRRLADRAQMIDVSGGWHLHLDVLEDVLAGRPPRPFWSRQAVLEADYGQRIGEEAGAPIR